MKLTFGADISQISGVGPKTKALLNRLNIYTAADLAYYFPNAYERFHPPQPLSRLMADRHMIAGQQSVDGLSANTPPTGRGAYFAAVEKLTQRVGRNNRSVVTAFVVSGKIKARLIFYGMPYIKSQLNSGEEILFYGTPEDKSGICFEQPLLYTKAAYEIMMSSLRPRYSLTKDLNNKKLTKIVNEMFDALDVYDNLEEEKRESFCLMPLGQALKKIHFPKDFDEQRNARKRLVFDEFYSFFASKKYALSNRHVNLTPITDFEIADYLIEKLPFQLTNAQEQAIADIKADLSGQYYANRLIQGDVGSGKTIVAVIALFCNAKRCQGALMAPTDVLARQHYNNILKLKERLGAEGAYLHVTLLTGQLTAGQRRKAYFDMETGAANVVVGTHALFQEDVRFRRLSLVITDEQHRFGVRQRERLLQKGEKKDGKGSEENRLAQKNAGTENLSDVHYISMSATPIPRTLSMLLYGDLDISLIDELPGNRLRIKNCLVDINYRKTAYTFIEKEILSGRQAYVVCPMVENPEECSENDSGEVILDTLTGVTGLENVTDYAKRLREFYDNKYSVGILHGKMNHADKYAAMEAFSAGQTKILVATTVVEVGVDVPNASVILIENAERFGLAQLHQLRGRVGRGDNQSYCILISAVNAEDSKKRLETIAASNDGFFIANEDLKLRGPGEPFGIRQSGELGFKLADIYEDADIMAMAKEAVA